eukprot:TRINITY_DN66967_c12_g2_i1.p1 TRINITY_DN66967_c12_g2~~TRINITY_DN66967_c12_g2_i1.p1  ORF type:complete len:582 (+),score=290.06 TRINITY_DN66967_c12_g2_i1:90-1835(+)
MLAFAWIMAAAAMVGVPLLAYILIRYYSDPEESSKVTTLAMVVALSVSLLCLFLIPVDIYTVSSHLDDMGLQQDPAQTEKAGQAVKGMYYVMYGVMLAMAFFFLPLAFFYFEEEEEDQTTGARLWAGMKYTIGFVIVFAILLGVGLVFKEGSFDANGESDQNSSWVHRLKDKFSVGDAIMTFCIAVLSAFGIFGWVLYTAYGMAYLPVALMRSRNSYATVSNSGQDRQSADIRMERDLTQTQERIAFLTARYDGTGDSNSAGSRWGGRASSSKANWSDADRKQLHKLRHQEKRLLRLKEETKKTSVVNRCAQVWNALAPLRISVGVVLLLTSLLVVVSMGLTMGDKLANSKCKSKCGYALDKADVINPIDLMLNEFAKAFPIDLFVFGGLITYIFLCTISGLVALGVRLCVFKLYDVQKRATMANGMVMGVWIVMFTVLLLNMQIVVLSPQYATFGNQFYVTESSPTPHHNTTSSSLATPQMLQQQQQQGGELVRHPCTLQHAFNGTGVANRCVMSQVGQFIHTQQLAMPVFGVVFFWANWAFVAMFLVFLIRAILRPPNEWEYQEMRDKRDADRSLWNDV